MTVVVTGAVAVAVVVTVTVAVAVVASAGIPARLERSGVCAMLRRCLS